MLIGDSQSAGAAGVPGNRTWTQSALRAVGYDVHFLGSGGIGFVASKNGASLNYPTALRQDQWAMPTEAPALIVVEGGRNDARMRASNTQMCQGVSTTIGSLRERYPTSEFLVIGTLAGIPSALGTRRASVDKLLGASARENNIHFVGAGDWLAIYDLAGQMADRVHLTQSGHDTLFTALTTRLKALQLTAAQVAPRGRQVTQ